MADLPLAGRTIVVTRSAEQAAGLAEPLRGLGADVVVMPVIAIAEPPDLEAFQRAVDAVASYDWVVFGSTNAVDRFFARVVFTDRTAEALGRVKLAAVGSATAARMREHGVEPDMVPDEFRAEGLVEAFRAAGAGPGWRVLVPRALEGREILREGLQALGCEVDVVAVYRTVPAEPDPVAIERLRPGAVDAVTFTSPSTVRNFLAVLEAAGIDAGDVMGRVVKASIGPVTSEALRSAGWDADVEADPSNMPALAAALAGRLAAAGDES